MQGSYHYQRFVPAAFEDSNKGCSHPFRILGNHSFKSLLFLAVTACTMLLGMIFGADYWVRRVEEKYPITSCGSTPDEARTLGCRFESHNFAWTPPDCYDEALNAKWDSKHWGYSRNPEGTDMIPRDEVLQGNLKWAYVTLNQHMSHCVLIWQKYQRAVMFSRPADNWTTSFAHTYHCGQFMVQWNLNHSEYNSILYTKYVSCGYDWKKPDIRMDTVMSGPMDGGLIGDGGNHGHGTGVIIVPGHEDEHHVH